MVKYISFDTETDRISYTNPVPEVICLTHSEAGSNSGCIVTPVETSLPALLHSWIDAGTHLIGHNIAYDMSVLAFQYPDLLPWIFYAYNAGLVHDTMIREKLLNICVHGNLDVLEVNGATVQIRYALKDLEQKYLGIDRSALKDDDDSPRLNYNIYKGVPLDKWSPEFLSYAIDDAIDTGAVFMKQEAARERCIAATGYDPLLPSLELFRTKVGFSLRLIECTGSLLDGDRVLKVAKQFEEEYNNPRLRDPLIAAGLLVPDAPPSPYANGAIDHLITCPGNPAHPLYKKGKKFKGMDACACPPKMKAGEPEHSPQKPLFEYVWNLAGKFPELIKAWPADACIKNLKIAGQYDQVVRGGAFTKEYLTANPVLPDGITLTVAAEWTETFAPLDPLLSIWEERKAIRKIVTDYLPKMFYTDPATGLSSPAKIIRGAYNSMVKSGRCSSFAGKLYPSRNEQNVDPRVRPCTVPRPGNVIVSTDYNGMELGTLAQKCVQMFGYSEMANKINQGIDTHAYLAAQIAFNMDSDFAGIVTEMGLGNNADNIFSVFKELKKVEDSCEAELPGFTSAYRRNHPDKFPDTGDGSDKKVQWANFFKHYRTLAKPTGLGYPGGLGAATFISYAKATFSLRLDLETAKKLKQIWLETYPEMEAYLKSIPKQMVDPHHPGEEYEDDDGVIQVDTWYAYDTPRGMHRSKCTFCECANGMGLQSFSAEGALDALNRVIETVWSAKEGDLLYGVLIIGFIHDEILYESPHDNLLGKRARAIEKIMIDAMAEITPDVKAGASSAAMYRWDKNAEGKWENDGTENERLLIWEPKEEAA